MYLLYVKWTKESGKPFATKHHYYNTFNTKFNIGFFTPKKDQCNLCEGFKNASENEVLEDKYTSHIKKKEESRQAKELDKIAAKQQENMHGIF